MNEAHQGSPEQMRQRFCFAALCFGRACARVTVRPHACECHRHSKTERASSVRPSIQPVLAASLHVKVAKIHHMLHGVAIIITSTDLHCYHTIAYQSIMFVPRSWRRVVGLLMVASLVFAQDYGDYPDYQDYAQEDDNLYHNYAQHQQEKVQGGG